jgi:hypothetical protein
MMTFLQWLSEATRRAGIAHWAYPDGYIRSHYPDLYFMPTAADAIQKMAPGLPYTQTKHHVKHYTPPDTALDIGYEPGKEYETD